MPKNVTTCSQKAWKRQHRSKSGNLMSRCNTVIHNETEDNGRLLTLTGEKAKVSQEARGKRINNCIISGKAKCIRSGCFGHLCEKKDDQFKKIEENDQETESDMGLGTTQQNGSENDELASVNVSEYLRKLTKEISKDITQLYDKKLCSVERLLTYNFSERLPERPEDLVKLLADLCRIPHEDLLEEDKTTFLISRIIELIYSLRNSRLQLPIAFSENLFVYSLTHSKQVVQYNSNVSPAESYQFLHKWILQQATDPIEFLKALIRSVFDNEQILRKMWRQ